MSGSPSTDILVAGAFAAFTVDLLVYPLDTLKTRLQSPDYKRLYTDGATGALRRGEMFRGLYQGLGSIILATLPSSGAFFTTYEACKSGLAAVNPRDAVPAPVIHSASSSIAELVSCAILTPAEVIKQNAQMVDTRRGGGSATMQTLAKFRSHPLALWRGYTALAGRNLPFTALQFPLFEKAKAMIRERREAQGKWSGSVLERTVVTAISAGSAGSVSAVITTPVDVVKTRIMLRAAEDAAAVAQEGDGRQPVDATGKPIQSPDLKESLRSAARNVKESVVDTAKHPVEAVKPDAGSRSGAFGGNKSSWAIGKEIVREHGVKGLWRGGALRGVWTMLGSGLYLGVYEGGRAWLGARRDRGDE